MIDQIRDALAYYDRTDHAPMPAVDPLAEGARRYAAGTPLMWCTEHNAPGGPRDGGPFDDQCYEWWICEVLGEECDGVTPCSVVEKWITDPPEKT